MRSCSSCSPAPGRLWRLSRERNRCGAAGSPHTNNPQTKNLPGQTSGKFPMDLGIPPLMNKNALESNPLQSRFSARGLAVWGCRYQVSFRRRCTDMGRDRRESLVARGLELPLSCEPLSKCSETSPTPYRRRSRCAQLPTTRNAIPSRSFSWNRTCHLLSARESL